MSTKKPWTVPPDHRFVETEYVCRPVDDVHDIWYRWHHILDVPWAEETRGHCATIGHVARRPICVTVWWAHIAMKRVAFVEGTSELVDYKMLGDWSRAVFPNAKAFANQQNFHNIIHPIEDDLNLESIIGRESSTIEKAIEAVPRAANFMRRKK